MDSGLSFGLGLVVDFGLGLVVSTADLRASGGRAAESCNMPADCPAATRAGGGYTRAPLLAGNRSPTST